MMTTYDNSIDQIVQSIFSAMFNIDLEVAVEPAATDTDTIRATVQISGGWRGHVLLEVSPGLACSAGAEMLQLSPQDVTETDQREVTTELVNMIGGNIKSALPGPSFLSLPSIVSEHEVAETLNGAELIDDVTLTSEQKTIRVRLVATSD